MSKPELVTPEIAVRAAMSAIAHNGPSTVRETRPDYISNNSNTYTLQHFSAVVTGCFRMRRSIADSVNVRIALQMSLGDDEPTISIQDSSQDYVPGFGNAGDTKTVSEIGEDFHQLYLSELTQLTS